MSLNVCLRLFSASNLSHKFSFNNDLGRNRHLILICGIERICQEAYSGHSFLLIKQFYWGKVGIYNKLNKFTTHNGCVLTYTYIHDIVTTVKITTIPMIPSIKSLFTHLHTFLLLLGFFICLFWDRTINVTQAGLTILSSCLTSYMLGQYVTACLSLFM